MSLLLEECRMVLPGIQTLFGFQLIAVFQPTFDQHLSTAERTAHLVALVFVAAAAALVTAPAAYHRQRCADSVDEVLVHVSSRLVLWSMPLLMAAICLDAYLVARVVLDAPVWSALLAAALLTVFAALWFVLPRSHRLQQLVVDGWHEREGRDEPRPGAS